MEKLIELLNEYELEREKGIEEFKNWALPLWEWSIDDGGLVYDGVEPSMNLESAYGDTANGIVISKSYGFIKWLVDNDKIDESKLIQGRLKYILVYEWQHGTPTNKGMQYLQLLMLLAIQDSPIEFLCSIIK